MIEVYGMKYDHRQMGQLIRKMRREKGLSQEVLSGLANIGRSHLAMIEAGKRDPQVEILWRIAAALNISMSALFARYEAECQECKDSAHERAEK